ncbi:MAG: LacI family DNA-binding transcriptional regulator [Microbacteriaceae bacterium]|nr:LacI family DNA-binding transcriptional regulator [Microbacteriaceae bacterium]
MSKRTKLSDVAEVAGVSTATVSRVLNGNERVDPELADRVRTALAELKYRRNRLARGLRQRSSSLIGAIIPDVSNPFFTDVVRGLEDGVREAGFMLVLCNSDEDPQKENDYLELLVDQQAAGIVLAPAGSRTPGLAEALDAGVRVVVIDRLLEGVNVDTVVLANTEGARALTTHLLESGGRVAHISGPMRASTASERVEGYRRALREHGLGRRDEIIIESDYTVEGGYAAMGRLLELQPRPDAVLVGNNVMTLGVLRRVAEAGLRPEDLRIGSFDPVPWGADPDRTVAVLEHPSHQLGTVAAELIMAAIADESHTPHTVVLPSGEIV